ncbi:MAG: TonB-dependent receptor [Candidatus Edwardsbacteria bacterium]
MLTRFNIIIALWLMAASNAHPAKGCSITGKVIDKSTKEPIVGATVTIVMTEKGTNTGMDGRFTIGDVDPGYYNVRISMMSYKPIVKDRVIVRPGVPTVLEIELEPQPLKMKDVVVRPTFFEKTKDAPVSSQRMDFEEIINQPGGGWDVQRAVQALPAVVSAADQDNEIIVRGGNYGENLFVLDNIEIANPNHFGWQGASGGPVTIINTDFVRQVDFIAGAFPAKYGDKASSVLDVKYREGLRDRFHTKFDLGMAGAGGTLEGPAGQGSYMISAHRSYLSLLKSSFGLTAVPHYYDIQGKCVYNLSPSLKFSVVGIYGKEWIRLEEEATAYGTAADLRIDAKSHQYTLGGTLQKLFRNGYASISLSRTLNYWNYYVTDTSDIEIHRYISTESENKARFDLVFQPSNKNEIAGGLYLKQPENDYKDWNKPETLFIYIPGTDSIIDTTGYISWVVDIAQQISSWKYGGYLQYKHNFGNFLAVTPGIRYDRFVYTDKNYLSPRIGANLRFTESTAMNLAYGRCYQPPEWYQLAVDTANHYLKSKYTDQCVIGFEHLFAEDTRGTIEGYYKSYYDVPTLKSYTTPDPNDWSNVYVNEGKGYAKGVELFLQKKVKQNLWGTVSYSYSIAKAKDPRNPQKEFNWDFDYRNVFTLISGYRKQFKGLKWYNAIHKKWWYDVLAFIPFVPADESEISLRYRYLGGKPYTSQKYHPEWRKWTVDADQPINSARMPAYQRLDFHIQRRWFFNKWNLLTYLEVENVFNNKNVWGYNYNEDGTMTKIYQMGRMIVGGFVAEF